MMPGVTIALQTSALLCALASSYVVQDSALSKDEYLSCLRQVLPNGNSTSVETPIFEVGQFRGRWKIERSNDGNRMRWLRLLRLYDIDSGALNDKFFATEYLVTESSFLESNVYGTCQDSDQIVGFNPEPNNLPFTNFSKSGGIAKKGGFLRHAGLAFGFVRNGDSIVDVHSSKFSQQCEIESESNETVLTHQPSKTRFVFGDDQRLLRIEFLEMAYRNEEWVKKETVVSPVAYDQSGRAIKFDIIPCGIDDHAYQLTLAIKEIDASTDLKKFMVVPAKNGDTVAIREGGNSAKRLILVDGIATYPIDPRAEEEIERILASENGSTRQIDKRQTEEAMSDAKRWPYLRAISSSDCGLYSFAIAAAKQGVRVDLESLLKDPEASSNEGSNVAQIRELAISNGLSPVTFRFGTLDNLIAFDAPVIVHCGNSYQTQGVSHWATILRVDKENRKVLWADLPATPVWIDETELLTTWDGTGIAILKDTPTAFQVFAIRFQPLILPCIMIAFAAIALRLGRMAFPVDKTTSLFDRNSAFSAVLLLFAAVAISLCWLSLSRNSFWFSDTAKALVLGKVADMGKLNRDAITEQHAWNDWHENPNSAIIDARVPQDFERGHISGAINLPTDCSLIELKEALNSTREADLCIVYCQSSSCPYSHQVAWKLAAMGYQDVIVYAPGYKDLPSSVPISGSAYSDEEATP